MPTKKLTDLVARNTKAPAKGRLELWDALLPGFGVRITDKGARSYFVMYRIDGPGGRKQRRLKIGDATAKDLADAREEARAALRAAARGSDPAIRDRRRMGAADSMRNVATDYLERQVARNTRPSTYRETNRIFQVDILPAWGHRSIGSITRRDVGELLDKVVNRGAEIQANRVLARLKTFFHWCVDEGALPASPIERMRPRTREIARDRVLSDEEIRWFWIACGAIGWPFGPMFRLLLVTLQRRDEVGGLSLAEIDRPGKLWTIPRDRAKNDRAHEVALSPLALEILAEAEKERPPSDALKKSPLLFTTTGETAASGFSRAKERLDAEMEHLARKDRDLPIEDAALRKHLRLGDDAELPSFVSPWTLHDLRRTGATGMARLSIPPHIVDRILNHVSGTIRGVAAVYNRHAYTDERKSALAAWSAYLGAIVQAPGANVAPMRARQA